jgi:hypothetical protein
MSIINGKNNSRKGRRRKLLLDKILRNRSNKRKDMKRYRATIMLHDLGQVPAEKSVNAELN